MANESVQSFEVGFAFPVCFTRNLFSTDNSTFLKAVTRLEPEMRHRVLFVIDQNILPAFPDLLSSITRYFEIHSTRLELLGPPVSIVGGEAVKNDFSLVLQLGEEINQRGVDRQSFLAVIGGGAVLDMACFVGAISHRGIRAIRIPTTVLSQSDSGVGVKNGVNWFGKKNFFGTFTPPFAVINDSAFIDTLEHRDKIAGLAEAVKVALIRDAQFYSYLDANASGLAHGDPEKMYYQIRKTAELHMRHIRTSGDPFESGSARPLDFGHWAAHKLESMTSNRLRHGEAVAIGMALDCVYAAKKGFLSPRDLEHILTLLQRLGLRLWDEALLDRDEDGNLLVLRGLQEFREHLGGQLTITMLERIGKSFEVHEMDESIIIESIQTLRSRARRADRSLPQAALVES